MGYVFQFNYDRMLSIIYESEIFIKLYGLLNQCCMTNTVSTQDLNPCSKSKSRSNSLLFVFQCFNQINFVGYNFHNELQLVLLGSRLSLFLNTNKAVLY